MKNNFEISNPEKILYKKTKTTKKKIIEYYKHVSEKMLPHLNDRPLSLYRCPDGSDKDCFFQKNASDYFPEYIKTKKIPNRKKGKTETVLCNSKDSLIYLANLAALEFHTWMSRADKLEYPDKIVLDIDPSKNGKDAKKAAHHLHGLLEKELQLKTFIMTTGSKGYHVIIPITRTVNFNEAKEFSNDIAILLHLRHPDFYTREKIISKRKEKVFLDYLRNEYGQMSIAPYSLRAKEKPTIAMPIYWKDLDDTDPDAFTVDNFSLRKKPWKEYSSVRQSIKKPAEKIKNLINKEKS